MNILFLSLVNFNSIKEHGIYTDLLRLLSNDGHSIYAISPVEKKYNVNTYLITEDNVEILKLKIGNIQKTNAIEKGISTILLDKEMISAINLFFKDVHFDLIIYCTPPITFLNVVNYIKKRDNAKTYLLLKDIFPQNALDIGLLNNVGLSGIIYKYFKNKEKMLYHISDKIGCMSKANVEYLLKNNTYIDESKVEVFPNSVEVIDKRVNNEYKYNIRLKYNFPNDKKIFIYGGNLGKPQGISFLLDALKEQLYNNDVYFLIVGDGTEKELIKEFINKCFPKNIRLFDMMTKKDYDELVSACDVGLIFLDYHFTIPNFPSRILSYMQAGLPILACTDKNCDLKDAIYEGKFGWWCESKVVDNFTNLISKIEKIDLSKYSLNSYNYFVNNYDIKKYYKKVLL